MAGRWGSYRGGDGALRAETQTSVCPGALPTEAPAAKKIKASDYMAILLKKSKKAALNVLKSFPERHVAFEAIHKKFDTMGAETTGTCSKITKETMKNTTFGDSKYGQMNELVYAMMGCVKPQLLMTIKDIVTIERFISLNIPVIEAGGNFGASVQASVLEVLKKKRTQLETSWQGLPAYHKERAAAMKECVCPKVEKTSTSCNETKTEGGKAEDAGEKKTTTKSTESSQSTQAPLRDHILHVVALDQKWFFRLQSLHQETMDVFAFICDLMIKNLEKVKNPRGTGGKGYTYN